MNDQSPNGFTLSVETVLAQQAKREALAEDLARLNDQISGIDRWLEAVSLVFPEAAQFRRINSQVDKEEIRSPLKLAILAYLNLYPQGLLPKDLAQLIRNGDDEELRRRLLDNPNGHHTALERLCSQKHVIKEGDRYFTPLHFWSPMRPPEDALADPSEKVGGMPDFVLSLFEPGVAKSPQDIIEEVKNHPVHSAALERNGGIVYSAINRLYKRKKLVRDGSYYVLAAKENEPSNAGASNGSDTDSTAVPNEGVYD